MRRAGVGPIWVAVAAAIAMTAVVATAPDDYPTPTDPLWGHLMPGTQSAIALALLVASALLAGVTAFVRLAVLRVAAAVAATLGTGLVLYGVCILAWRLHAPVSAGDGG